MIYLGQTSVYGYKLYFLTNTTYANVYFYTLVCIIKIFKYNIYMSSYFFKVKDVTASLFKPISLKYT